MVGLCLKGVNSLPAYEIGAKEGLNHPDKGFCQISGQLAESATSG
jgi:hypothetical protein